MAALEKKNEKYIHIRVKSPSAAAQVLEHGLSVKNYIVDNDDSIRIYDTDIDLAVLNKAMAGADTGLTTVQVCNDNLEDYFKRMTGGVGIA